MKDKEMDLSLYIDSLNAEKKPDKKLNPDESPEMEELMKTVRVVRSLKEPAMPDSGYPEKLARAVSGSTEKRKNAPKAKRARFMWFSASAAVFVIAAVLYFILPAGGKNIAYAMEQAFQGVKAYHGIIEVVETNGEGADSVQSRLEVWADKSGHYSVKVLEGFQEGLVTANNGSRKWQVQPDLKQVSVFPAFPDPYGFTFEIGKEIEEVKNALEIKNAGEDVVAGRKAEILEVSPKGGEPYRIWVDSETKLPLQRQSAMQNALQYTVTYTEIDFVDTLPSELTAYSLPQGFKEIAVKPEQMVSGFEEAADLAGFVPKIPVNIPQGYVRDGIAVETDGNVVKYGYKTQDGKNVVVLQKKADGELKPASTAILGKVNGSTAEIQSPVVEGSGVLGAGTYAGITGIRSIRWQQDKIEYAVIGDVTLEQLVPFVKSLNGGAVEIPQADTQLSAEPAVEVQVDMEVEKNDQKSADAGHSPWKLDPLFVAQVFVSLKVSPDGIVGDYPVKQEDLKVVQSTGTEVVVEVSAGKAPVGKVYLKRLVRQDSTGIWTVVGYDPAK